MNNFTQKINYIKWLQAMGVEYYYHGCHPRLAQCHSRAGGNPQYSNIVTCNTMDPRLHGDDIVKDRNDIKEYGNSINTVVTQARLLADKADNIEELKELLLNFNGCELKKFAKNTVFSDGNPYAPIMLIGEAPGNNEDLQGIPFCGESGKLLDNMLFAIGISRKDNAYITNTVFWRPPANRQPTLEEVDICRPFIEKHIALINPKLIILIGSTAATSLLGKNAGITKIRQEYYFYTNKYLKAPIHTTAIFHPAYLLRQLIQKKNTWYDLLKIQDYINAKREI